MIANNRRKAVSSVKQVAVQRTSATTGSEIRKAMVAQLSIQEFTRLKLFTTTTTNKTEADEFLVFKCHAKESHGKISVETDTCPKLIATELIGLNEIEKSDFFLPAHAVLTNNTWTQNLPRFDRWAMSIARYPTIGLDNKSIVPNRTGESILEVSNLDIYDMYTTTLITTLTESMRTPSPNLYRMCYLLVLNIGDLVKLNNADPSSKPPPQQLDSYLQQFEQLIINRDANLQSAQNYKTFVNTTSPSCFYWMLYNLAITNQTLCHKSHQTNLDTFLYGIVTTTMASSPLHAEYSGIEDIFLRMVLERSMSHIPAVKFSTICDFTTEMELIAYLHQNVGQSVENSLRHWSYLVLCLHEIIKCIEKPISLVNFTERLKCIHEQIRTVHGILPFCLLISPSSEQYLTEANLAEFIFTISKNKDNLKGTTLQLPMLSSHMETPLISNAIHMNLQRIANALELSVSVSVSAYKKDQGDQADQAVHKLDVDLLWNSFKPYADEYKKVIMKYAIHGTHEYVDVLCAFIEKMDVQPNPLLGRRRSITLILRVCDSDSAIFQHFSQFRHPKDIINFKQCLPKSGKWQCLRDYMKGKQLPALPVVYDSYKIEKADNEPIHPIEFIPFERAREIVAVVRSLIQQHIDQLQEECPICFDVLAVGQSLVALHGDVRHGVCGQCENLLMNGGYEAECPFCRQDLKQQPIRIR